MVIAVALHSIVPVRSNPSEEAEQLTQMLFAETCDIVAEKCRWKQVKLHLDGQQGWVDAKMVSPLSEDEYVQLEASLASAALVRLPMTYAVSGNNGQTLPLTAGTRLPAYSDGQFSVLGVTFRIDPQAVATKPLDLNAGELMTAVRFFLNTPYLWGGKNALGMDCSGFSQVVMSLFGIKLPRNASEQAREGKEVPTLQEAVAGDLVFFNHADINPAQTNISHVGILIDSQRVVHCSGRVKVERIDANGIFSVEIRDSLHPDGQYTHHLASVRRYSCADADRQTRE